MTYLPAIRNTRSWLPTSICKLLHSKVKKAGTILVRENGQLEKGRDMLPRESGVYLRVEEVS